jgi:hypothetical protein
MHRHPVPRPCATKTIFRGDTDALRHCFKIVKYRGLFLFVKGYFGNRDILQFSKTLSKAAPLWYEGCRHRNGKAGKT